MSTTWVVQLPAVEISNLSRLCHRDEVEVCETGNELWLRGKSDDPDRDADVLSLPGNRFSVTPDEQLIPSGKRIPRGQIPPGPWLRLQEWMQVSLPTASFSGELTTEAQLTIVRGGSPVAPNLLLTSFSEWRRYALRAPQVRLQRWSFAVGPGEQAVVRGAPIPPVPGVQYVEQDGIAIAAGWRLQPHVDADVLRTALGLKSGELAVFREDGSWYHLRSEDFVMATRAAVRSTASAEI